MFALRKQNKLGSARAQIDIEAVRDDILCLTRKRYRAVLEVSSLNFELRSEEEQDAIIETYESFLNSVGTPLQILVRTRAIDMDKYLEDVEAMREKESEKIYKDQLANYDLFIRSLITNNTILSRHFYVIIPFTAESGTDFDLIKEQLATTTDIVAKGLQRLGMHSRQLNNLELLDLFYSFYSPKQAKLQPLSERTLAAVHQTLTTVGDAA